MADVNESSGEPVTEGSLKEVKEGSLKEVKAGSLKEVKEGSLKELKQGSLKEVKGGSLKEVKEGSLKEVKEGSLKEVKEESLKEIKEGSLKEVKGGGLKERSSSKTGSKEGLNKGSRQSSKQSFKEGSTSDVKAQIFASSIKDEAGISTVKSCESPGPGSRGSIKSHPSRTSSTRVSRGSTDSAGPCKTFITTSTGSIRSVEVKKSSKTPSTALGSAELLKSEADVSRGSRRSKGSLTRPIEGSLGEIDVYDEGPCKVHDIVSMGSHESKSSAFEIARSTLQQILDENIPVPMRSIVKEIVEKAMDESAEKAMDESSATEIVRQILEEILPDSKTLLRALRKSQQITYTPDDIYLKKHLGVPLTHALAEIVMKQPEDPIHYLAHWLFKWRWNEQHKQEKDDEINALTMERERRKEEAEEKARIEAEQKALEEERAMAREEGRRIVDEAVEHVFEILGIPEDVDPEKKKEGTEEDEEDEEEARDEFDEAKDEFDTEGDTETE